MKYSTRVEVPFKILQTYIPNVHILISLSQDFQRFLTNNIVVPLHVPQHVNRRYPRNILNLWYLLNEITVGFERAGYSLHFPVLGVLSEIQYSFSFFFSFFMYISVNTTGPLPLHTPLPLGGYFSLKNWTKS